MRQSGTRQVPGLLCEDEDKHLREVLLGSRREPDKIYFTFDFPFIFIEKSG